MDIRKIENAQDNHIKDIFDKFDKSIILNSKIEQNKYKLNTMLLNENKRNQIPWNSLFFIYTYVMWSPEDKILTKGIIKKVFNSLIEYEVFKSNMQKENTYGSSKTLAIKKFEGWENSINDLYHKENYDILIHWVSDDVYLIGKKKEN